MAGLTHPRGDTLSLACARAENGTPTDLTGWTVRSQVRTYKDELVCELTVTIANQTTAPGQFTLSATAAQTTLWPTRERLCDIEFIAPDGSVNSSEIFTIAALQDVTR